MGDLGHSPELLFQPQKSHTQLNKEVKGQETEAISLGFFPPQALAPAVYRAKKMKGLNPGNCQRTSGGLLLEAGAPVL